PLVSHTSRDPGDLVLVASLSRPSGNATGATALNIEVTPKRLEILHELLPTAKLFGLLVNPTNPYAEILSRNAQAAASTLGLQLHILQASTEHDFDAVFANLIRLRSGGLVIGGTGIFLDSRHVQLAALALRHSVPTIYHGRSFALAGGLMSYGGSTWILTEWQVSTLATSSRARNRPSCRLCSHHASSSSSTSRPRRRSAWKCQRRCLPAPMR